MAVLPVDGGTSANRARKINAVDVMRRTSALAAITIAAAAPMPTIATAVTGTIAALCTEEKSEDESEDESEEESEEEAYQRACRAMDRELRAEAGELVSDDE